MVDARVVPVLPVAAVLVDEAAQPRCGTPECPVEDPRRHAAIVRRRSAGLCRLAREVQVLDRPVVVVDDHDRRLVFGELLGLDVDERHDDHSVTGMREARGGAVQADLPRRARDGVRLEPLAVVQVVDRDLLVRMDPGSLQQRMRRSRSTRRSRGRPR